MSVSGPFFNGEILFEVQGKRFRMSKIFRIRSTFIDSAKKFQETIGIKASTTELIENTVPFRL